jgi:hypothetical protein
MENHWTQLTITAMEKSLVITTCKNNTLPMLHINEEKEEQERENVENQVE